MMPRLLPLIRQICSERATNGYRRVTAHPNRALKEKNWRVNPKRIYRIMQANNLLLAKSGHRKPERSHTGNVVTLKPDTHWCSDGFEIRSWNREVVRVVFSLDCCDREAICWLATIGGINSVMVRNANAPQLSLPHQSLCVDIFFIITIIVLLYFCRLRSLWTGPGSEIHMDKILTTASLHRYNIINNANDAQPYIKISGFLSAF